MFQKNLERERALSPSGQSRSEANLCCQKINMYSGTNKLED